MCANTVSSAQINGHIIETIPIRCYIREAFPMRKVHFAQCVNPKLKLLGGTQAGLCLGRSGRRRAVVAYEDVMIFVTMSDDFRVIRCAGLLFEKAQMLS
jgi:hypothetical protein